jgi:hypothetical protein
MEMEMEMEIDGRGVPLFHPSQRKNSRFKDKHASFRRNLALEMVLSRRKGKFYAGRIKSNDLINIEVLF